MSIMMLFTSKKANESPNPLLCSDVYTKVNILIACVCAWMDVPKVKLNFQHFVKHIIDTQQMENGVFLPVRTAE